MDNKDNCRKNGHRTFKEKLGEGFDIPPDLLCGGCRVEIRGRGEAVIEGCRKVVTFTPDIIRLAMSDFNIVIEGERLNCLSFCEGSLVIGGRINRFVYEERGE